MIALAALLVVPCEVDAQAKKKEKKSKKGKREYQDFIPAEELTPEQRRARMVNPVRKFFNQFNLSLERGYGFFSYQNTLKGLKMVRSQAGDSLYIIVPGSAKVGSGPVTGYSNWFNDLEPINIPRIDEADELVDANNLVYRNSGRLNPLTLRLSYSIRKVRTGERIMTDNEFLRIGGGISFGRINFKKEVNTQNVNSRLGNFKLPVTRVSTTKVFGSVTVNAYKYGDLSLLADVSAGIWKIRSRHFNRDFVTHDPFFNIGLIFEKKFSKYFKVYIRPSFEMRRFGLANGAVSVRHGFSIFTIDIGALIKYPVYPRNRFKAHRVQMEHVFRGRIYRGRSIFQRQNPRIGQHGLSRKKKVRTGRNH